MMIVKVQRSLFPPDAECLIYNEDRTVGGQFPVENHIKRLMGDEMKAYFEAEYRESDGKIVLGMCVPDQHW